MRKFILTAIIITVAFCTNAQDSLSHKSVVVYEFKDFSVIVISPATTDSLLNRPDTRKKSPSKERILSVHSGILKILLTTNKTPFPHSVTRVALDSDTNNNKTMAIKDLERKSGLIDEERGKKEVQYSDWKDVDSFPLSDRDTCMAPKYSFRPNPPVVRGDTYIVFAFSVGAYNTRIISIRNKNTKEEILNLRLIILDDPVLPFLAHFAHNDAERKIIDSFTAPRPGLVTMRMPNIYKKGSEKVFEYPKQPPHISRVINNEHINETSGLAFYFENEGGNYPDSSMEFRLLSESNKDTSWIKTGHRLVIPPLVRGDNYKLQVRYELHPFHLKEYTFYVVPKWYQTTQTKIIFAGVLILFALLTWLLAYRRLLNKSRRRKEQLSLEIKSIRSQLNPHFIFNALASIQGLINKNDVPAANHYLTEFSTLLRESLHNNDKEMVALITEVNLLETYLKLEQLRFNFKYEVRIDPAINKNATEIPYLILQPLVENAVKHGVSTLAEKGIIKIDFIKREHDLLVLITDNGNKFDETQDSKGFGLKLTRNRISLLNQSLKEQPIKLSIERRQDMETIVNLVFTNWI